MHANSIDKDADQSADQWLAPQPLRDFNGDGSQKQGFAGQDHEQEAPYEEGICARKVVKSLVWQSSQSRDQFRAAEEKSRADGVQHKRRSP